MLCTLNRGFLCAVLKPASSTRSPKLSPSTHSDPDRVARVRGHAFLSVLASLEELRGPGANARVMAALPPSLEASLRTGCVQAEKWYPIERYRELLATVRGVTDEGSDLIRSIGFECSRADLSGMYGFFGRLLRPQTLFSGAMRLFKSYYDTGEVWVVAASQGAAHALWKECHGFDENMWLEVVGSCAAILEVGGARNVELRVVNGGKRHDSYMELKATWT